MLMAGMCRMVHDTDIVELELKSKRFSLAVRKKEALELPEPTVVYQVCLSERGIAGLPGQSSNASIG